MMAAAITRALKLETVRRTADGGVWVADTSGPGRTKVAHSRQRYRMGVSVSWMRSLLHSLHVPSACSFRTGDICCRAFPKYSAACARLLRLSSGTQAAAATLPPLRPVGETSLLHGQRTLRNRWHARYSRHCASR